MLKPCRFVQSDIVCNKISYPNIYMNIKISFKHNCKFLSSAKMQLLYKPLLSNNIHTYFLTTDFGKDL